MSSTKWLSSSPTKATNTTANTKLFKYLVRLIRGEDLSLTDSVDFFNALTEENADPAQIAGALTALTAKGETPEELAGMTRVIQEKAVKIDARHKNFLNTAGTNMNSRQIFNVSTGSALITAGAGIPIIKQTYRRTIANRPNTDVLGNLGIRAAETVIAAESSLNGAGICYMYAPKFHPALRRVGNVRRKLGIHSCLKLLGVLANPAGAPRQLIGVWHPDLVEPLARALALLETRRAWVVHGSDGLDKLTLAGDTYVAEVIGGKIRKFRIQPKDFGLRRGNMADLEVKTPAESAQVIKDVLSGQRRDEARSLLVINSAVEILIGGMAGTPMQAARVAEQSIYSNSAQVKLERLNQTAEREQTLSVAG